MQVISKLERDTDTGFVPTGDHEDPRAFLGWTEDHRFVVRRNLAPVSLHPEIRGKVETIDGGSLVSATCQLDFGRFAALFLVGGLLLGFIASRFLEAGLESTLILFSAPFLSLIGGYISFIIGFWIEIRKLEYQLCDLFEGEPILPSQNQLRPSIDL
ncbi:hypothetical protein [Pontibacter sp. G13]|uniref:hypothetical protein n=1 Tax=Pontibacter sp. G13 TaxID=3074898 RepID=UPI0028890598|nr:hypothetical protein [Pontibacter sp. G13]WNJ19788.1 hypothetical protein RJD25_04835 [Pontibacter sp. G13]